MNLTGRKAVITGAAGGIGAAIALRLAEHDAAVVASDLPHANTLPDVVAQCRGAGSDAVAAPLDATDADAIDDLFSTGPAADADILVNAAGVLFPTRTDQISEREWDLVMDVNLKATFLMSQRAARGMRERG